MALKRNLACVASHGFVKVVRKIESRRYVRGNLGLADFLLLSQFCMNLKNCPVAVDENEGSLRLSETSARSSDDTNGNR